MAKRGRPAKEKAAAETSSEAASETMTEDTALDFDTSERDALIDQYNESEGRSDTSTEEEVTEKTEESSEKDTEASAEKEETVEEGLSETEQAKGEDEKTVPLGALHEEREKRKALGLELEEVKGQLHTVLQDLRGLNEAKKTEETAAESEELSPVEILEKRIASLEDGHRKTDSTMRADKQAKKDQDLDRDIIKVDQELESEGFPGFQFMRGTVTQKLNELIREDPQNRRVLDNPEGWKKVYKGTIFPMLNAKFAKKDKSDLFDKKKDLKAEVNLARPGKKVEKLREEEWTYQDYLQMRFDKQIA